MKRGMLLLGVLVAIVAAGPGVARADGACPPGQYETSAGCECPSGQHATTDGGCATDDLGACPAGQYPTTNGCVCPAGQHESVESGECATESTPAIGTSAVAGAHHVKKKPKKHRHAKHP